MARLSFGYDASSTGHKLVALDIDAREIIATYQLDMRELASEFGFQTTEEGMVQGANEGEYSFPGHILAEGLERVMLKAARDDSFKNEDVVAMSFSVQGHLTAYLIGDLMQTAITGGDTRPLRELVEPYLTCECPTWKNSSTKQQSATLNGLMKERGLNVITMAERYPGSQISKRVGTEAYQNATSIMVGNALFPFFVTGVPTFSGPGDAAASGFVDLSTLRLDERAMKIIAPDLHEKVKEVTPAGSLIGRATERFRQMGFTNLNVYTSDQDNIKSSAYLIFDPGHIMPVSLATSYTASPYSKFPIPGFEGNFGSNHPDYPYMPLLCKNNGSTSLVSLLDEWGWNSKDFERISKALQATKPGNDGAMALPWFQPEIVPYAPDAHGVILHETYGERLFAKDMRAAVEANAASMKNWSDHYFGDIIPGLNGIAFAGGTTNNLDVLQVWTNMFGVKGYCLQHAQNAAAVGAALTAAADYLSHQPDSPQINLSHVVASFIQANPAERVIEPDRDASAFYREVFRPAYAQFEAQHSQKR